ncbi:MAG: hypothetical protein ACOVMP_03390 [Chthoniobacterales bacterium]
MKHYTLNDSSTKEKIEHGIQIAYDVGHSSLGWAVLSVGEAANPEIAGCGVVTFPTDDCLASQRRDFRRQRRHIRSTRFRVARIEQLLLHLKIFSQVAINAKHTQGGGHSAPWFLAARALRGGALLTWDELWDVLRWYAHNRGYDGNRKWSSEEPEAEKEDTEKVETARSLLKELDTQTMCETFCAISGLDPLAACRT